jgi:hypothetical protein
MSKAYEFPRSKHNDITVCDSCKHGQMGNAGSEQPGYIWSRWSCKLMPDRKAWVLKLDLRLHGSGIQEVEFDKDACPLLNSKK